MEIDGRPVSQLTANLAHNVLFNLSGHPVLTLPIGLTPAGLPLGVQLVGRRWQEGPLLDAAAQIDAVIKGYRRPPGF
jgi:amidase